MNYAYVDALGRETVTWIRTFQTKRPRHFVDAYMVYSEQRSCIVDYLGTHQHLAVDIDLKVAANGGLSLRSGAQRFYEGPIGFSFPMLFSGVADVLRMVRDNEWVLSYRSLGEEPYLGSRFFGYKGRFQVEWRSVASDVPEIYLPQRTEPRE